MAHDTGKQKKNPTSRIRRRKSASVVNEFFETRFTIQEQKLETISKKSKKVTPVTDTRIKSKNPTPPILIKQAEQTKDIKVSIPEDNLKRLPIKSKTAVTETNRMTGATKKVSAETADLKVNNKTRKTPKQNVPPENKKSVTNISPVIGKPTTEKHKNTATSDVAEKIEKNHKISVLPPQKVTMAAEPMFNEAKIAAFIKKSKKHGKQASAEISGKKVKQNIEAENKTEKVLTKEVEAAETIETAIIPPPVKPKNKKAKPLSSAVFRGRKNKYDFEVFDLDEIFEPIPAVYVISKRITDKKKKGHHKLVCIGETISLAEDIKRHRKSKCLRKANANVISILKEEDEHKRTKIETDLKAAHSIQCNIK